MTGVNVDRATERRLKVPIYKNLAALSCSFFFVYTAYLALFSLQSSLNQDHNIGLIALCLLYSGYVVGVTYAPFAVDFIGTKCTLLAAFVAHTVFIISNFYPKWWTLLPAALLLGSAKAPQFTAQSVVISRLAIKYSLLTKAEIDGTLSKFNSIALSAMFLSGIPGSLVSSLLLSKSTDKGDITGSFGNFTTLTNRSYVPMCGSQFCPDLVSHTVANVSSSNTNTTSWSIYIVLGIYLAVNIAGVLVAAIFMENVKEETNKTKKVVLRDLVGLFKTPFMPCLLVITALNGSTNSFSIAIFTNSFISCSLDIAMVGYGYVCYTLGRSIASVLSGFGGRCIPRALHFLFVFGLLAALYFTCLLWLPTSRDIAILCVMLFGFGSTFGVIDIQIKSIIALSFPHKLSAAFSLRCLADGFGHAVALFYMAILCTRTILYIHLGILVCGVAAYLFIYWKMRRGITMQDVYRADKKQEGEDRNLNELS